MDVKCISTMYVPSMESGLELTALMMLRQTQMNFQNEIRLIIAIERKLFIPSANIFTAISVQIAQTGKIGEAVGNGEINSCVI